MKGDDGIFRASPSLIPSTTQKMTNTTLDKAIAAVPKFRDRISLFTKKLRLAQYADGSIYDYRLLQTPEQLRHEVSEEMHSLTTSFEHDKHSYLKNPVIAEFLELPVSRLSCQLYYPEGIV